MTIVELMLVVAVLAVIAALALPAYSGYIDKAKQAQAAADIADIDTRIAQYVSDNRALPPSLAVLSGGARIDPWGNPYQYLDLSSIRGKSLARKDRSLVPINSDYDLYSMGKDGQSVPPLTARQSRDDIVRARNGAYIGPASGF